MTCLDCWEWFVEIIVRQNSLGIDSEPKENPNKPGKSGNNVPVFETSSLSTFDPNEFRRDRMKQLFNRHGYNLAIFPGGHVKGVREAFNLYSVMEIIPTASVGECMIRGVETGLFLAMNENGQLYGEQSADKLETHFFQSTSGPFILYLSKKNSHLGWYVGIKKDGGAKNGRRTWYPWGQKAVLFTHRKPYAEHHPLRQLKNRHRFTLVILPDGKIKGITEEEGFSKYSVLEFNPTEPPKAFRIRGVESDLYLAMNEKGRLYGEKDRYNENTIFAEHSQGHYFVYLSVTWSHKGWHLGIKRSGKAKKGTKTVYPSIQKAIQFQHIFPFPTPENVNFGGGIFNQDHTAIGEQNFPPLAFIDEDQED